MKIPWLIAHRGLSADYPENTLPAFEKALELPVNAIEFDVHPTKDGELVITHDDTLERCSNGSGRVADHTFAELRKLDFGSWKGPQFAGTRIPTLCEVLDLVEAKRPELYLCVELKENDCRCAREVIRELERRRRIGNCSIISFHPQMLFYVKGMNEGVFAHGFLDAETIDLPQNRELLKLIGRVGIFREKMSRELTARFRDLGIEVDSWAADNEAELDRMLQAGVDTVTSNAPNRILHRFQK